MVRGSEGCKTFEHDTKQLDAVYVSCATGTILERKTVTLRLGKHTPQHYGPSSAAIIAIQRLIFPTTGSANGADFALVFFPFRVFAAPPTTGSIGYGFRK